MYKFTPEQKHFNKVANLARQVVMLQNEYLAKTMNGEKLPVKQVDDLKGRILTTLEKAIEVMSLPIK